MFTGIVTDVGKLVKIDGTEERTLFFETRYDTAGIAIGSSIACSGACLTVLEVGKSWFSVSVSAETLSCTVLGEWGVGTLINLERALQVGDELGGHLVSGHIDGVTSVISVQPEGDSWRVRFHMPDWLRQYVVPKGSITIDGVSLTVNEVRADYFEANVIPHTQKVTTLGTLQPGTPVNIEIDLLARYVERSLRVRDLID